MGVTSGLDALDWVGTLLQSRCGEEGALISDRQGQVWMKSRLNTVHRYVCVWGSGEQLGTQVVLAFPSISFHSCKVGPVLLAHADLPAPGPRLVGGASQGGGC